MLVRAMREVIVQGLNRRDARVTNEPTRDLRDGLVRHAAGLGDLRPVTFASLQSLEDAFEHSDSRGHGRFRAFK